MTAQADLNTAALAYAASQGMVMAPPPVPPVTPPAGRMLFDGGFEGGTAKPPWSAVYEEATDRIEVYSTATRASWPVPRSGKYACRINVGPTDFGTAAAPRSTGNRAQLETGDLLHEGDEAYISLSALIPSAGLPADVGLGNGFFAFAELMGDSDHGSPESGAWVIRQDAGNPASKRIALAHGSDNQYKESFSTPLLLDQWFDIVYRVKLSHDPAVGSVSVWFNGVAQNMINPDGSRTSPVRKLATMGGKDAALRAILCQYHEYGEIPVPYAMFYDRFKVASTYALAAAL